MHLSHAHVDRQTASILTSQVICATVMLTSRLLGCVLRIIVANTNITFHDNSSCDGSCNMLRYASQVAGCRVCRAQKHSIEALLM